MQRIWGVMNDMYVHIFSNEEPLPHPPRMLLNPVHVELLWYESRVFLRGRRRHQL